MILTRDQLDRIQYEVASLDVPDAEIIPWQSTRDVFVLVKRNDITVRMRVTPGGQVLAGETWET